MRGIILCGGTGSRLYPLTKCINKHLLPVGGKPMAQWNIEKLVEAGINDILIISGKEHCGSIIQQFGDGSEFNCKLTYKVQEKAGGIAEAIALAEDFAHNESICVILGDNLFSMKLTHILSYKHEALIFIKEVSDPERFGVAEFYQKLSQYGNDVTVTSIEEKPRHPKSSYAVTGIYIYPPDVFKKIKQLTPSARGELEVTDLNNLYLNEHKLCARKMNDNDWWTDAGTFESYYKANKLIKGEN